VEPQINSYARLAKQLCTAFQRNLFGATFALEYNQKPKTMDLNNKVTERIERKIHLQRMLQQNITLDSIEPQVQS